MIPTSIYAKKLQRITAYFLAAFLCLAVPRTALAAGPGELSELTAEEQKQLADDVAQWSEIQNLVTCYNPTYRIYADSAAATSDVLSSAGDSFQEEMDQNLEQIEKGLETVKAQREKLAALPGSTVIDGSGTTASQALAGLDATEAGLKKNRTEVKQSTGKALSSVTSTRLTARESLKPVREQIAHAVENLFISYEQLLVNRSLVEKQIELYETVLSTQESLKEEDMATQADVASARASLSEAKVSLNQIDNGIAQLKTAIGLQLGWSADSSFTLGKIPDPDLNFPDTVEKEADYQKALENNSSYKTTKELKNYSGSSALKLRDAALNEADGAASAKFEELYANMQKQKLLYEASETSLKRARLTREQAERMFRLGLLGNAEYQGRQMEYLSCEASVELARLAYFAAINEYQWAVRGYMEY